jgi:CheY-like chemotaxis protein
VSGPLVAVVNHDPAFIRLMQSFLSAHGYEVIGEIWSTAALQMMGETAPDLAVIDMWLEIADAGWEVLRVIRADKALCAMPVVLTSHERESLARIEWELDHRTTPMLTPLDLDALLSVIRSTLGAAD